MEIDKNYSDDRFEKYNSLVDELSEMIDYQGRGYHIAQQLNDEFWEELGTHRKRMLEQIEVLQKSPHDAALQTELQTSEDIYEATRRYLNKFGVKRK